MLKWFNGFIYLPVKFLISKKYRVLISKNLTFEKKNEILLRFIRSTIIDNVLNYFKNLFSSPFFFLLFIDNHTTSHVLSLFIESLNNQKYKKWKLRVIILGNTVNDLLPNIISELKQSHNYEIVNVSRENIDNCKLFNAKDNKYFIAISQNDILHSEYLSTLSKNIKKYPDTDIFYSDHRILGIDGKHMSTNYKPDWSPELLLAYNYVGNNFVVKKDFLKKLNGFNLCHNLDIIYDFLLRAIHKYPKVIHVDNVLYSICSVNNQKYWDLKSSKLSLENNLNSNKINADIKIKKSIDNVRKYYFSLKFEMSDKSVAIIIPTKNNKEKLEVCLNTIKKTKYISYKIYVIDDSSDDEETLEYLSSLPGDIKVFTHSPPDRDFNFSHQINKAAEFVKEEYLLLLNDDTEIINPEWLNQMVGYAQSKGVGAVGAKLIYPNNTIQHAGIIHLHRGKYPKHSFRFSPKDSKGYLSYLKVARNYIAVTAACMLTPRKLFFDIGGFDEEYFAIAYNDVDYCLRLHKKGYRCVYCPEAELYHYEGASRGKRQKQIEKDTLQKRYRKLKDPYYNQNLIDMGIYDYNIE